jgi:uncharacterized membrane protein
MAAYHPEIVHFTIALLILGVAFRIASLFLHRPLFAYLAPAAFTLLIIGTVASVFAAQSGTAAHGAVERIPGARAAVETHQDWGEDTRDVFFIVAVLEVVGLALARSPKLRYLYAASALVGIVGLYCLYQAGEAGGRLVYSYAGGVGTRSGDPADVERLLLAGMYQEAQLDRRQGNNTDASALLAQAAARWPDNVEVQLAAAESLLVDKKDPQAALAALKKINPPPDNRFLRMRHATLTANALVAAGQRDQAVAVLQELVNAYPNVKQFRQRLDALKSGQ